MKGTVSRRNNNNYRRILAQMSFSDDEPIVASPDVSVGKPASFPGGKTKVTVINNTEAPLDETKFQALIELTGSGSGEDRPGIDLITVLDNSGSMTDDGKIFKMKTAMQFVVRKLSPIDRLSVVTFSENAARLCPLRQMTETAQPEIEGLVDALVAGGPTNITAGLETALRILKDRRLNSGRVVAIMLMSDGQQNRGGDAAKVSVGDIPIYTFGFGANHEPTVLKGVADNSKGGTFSDVQNQNNLSVAFSQCLAGLLTVVVQDLKVTVAPTDTDRSKVDGVSTAGNYPQSTDNDLNSITVFIGDLYIKEVRKIVVYLTLPEVPKRISDDVLEINYSYSNGENKPAFFANPITITVTRSRTAPEESVKKDAVVEEESRLRTADIMKQARVMADENNLEDAKDMLAEADNMLSDDPISSEDSPLIEMLRAELKQLSKLMKSQDTYEKKGRPFALSSETSHARQRFATRGDVDKLRLFATPRMDAYLEQAKEFDKDPTKPIPSVQEDVKNEIAADPLSPIVGPLSYYLQTAIQALQAIQNIINKATT